MKSSALQKPGGRGPMPSVTATAAKNEFGRVLDTAVEQGAVAITRHDVPKVVLLSVDEYRTLVAAGGHTLDALRSEFDALYASMQTPRARRATKAAFDAAPEEISKAAVAQARARRRG